MATLSSLRKRNSPGNGASKKQSKLPATCNKEILFVLEMRVKEALEVFNVLASKVFSVNNGRIYSVLLKRLP